MDLFRIILNLKDLDTFDRFDHFKMESIQSCSQLMRRLVTQRPLTCGMPSGMPTIQGLLQRAPKISSIHMAGKHISIYLFGSGALFRPPFLQQTYETCVFVPQGVGTYFKWLL